MERFSDILNGKFGFGCMRMQTKEDGEIDLDNFCAMVDCYLNAGFNYFDTAHVYFEGRSEKALKAGLTSRYPRERYVLTDKLSSNCFETEEDIRPLFQRQLDACGVEYFDFYLFHAMCTEYIEKYERVHAFEVVKSLKAEGKVKHIGTSFHDQPEVLDKLLFDHPEIEIVQIQYNYLDLDDPNVRSADCLEVCKKHDKPVLIMEPVKGGSLVFLPEQSKKVLSDLNDGSPASLALRFAAEPDQVVMVLSGVTTLEQMQENVTFMKELKPLSEEAHAALRTVVKQIRALHLIECTGCRYCTEGCPANINIPGVFRCLNDAIKFPGSKSFRYAWITSDHGKASDCLECGACEEVCPQHLPIRDLMKKAVEAFE